MCLGVPYRVIESDAFSALCEGPQGRCRIDTMLVGVPVPGQWLVASRGIAQRAVGDAEAARLKDALDAVQAAQRGDALDAFFADLVGREPALPEHLRKSKEKP